MANRRPETHDLKGFATKWTPKMGGHIGELLFIDPDIRYRIGKYQVGDYVVIYTPTQQSSQYKITQVLSEDNKSGRICLALQFSPRGSVPL